MNTIHHTIAQELNVKLAQIEATVKLLDEGATVPFIARYRKEVTGGLDDTQLRTLAERLIYLRELEERRVVILESIKTQEKLTPELEKLILAADNKARLEDLYLPYKPKRRTKAQIAIEAGLEPLANSLLENPSLDPQVEAAKFLNPEKDIKEPAQALEGARHILMERFAESADLIASLREFVWEHAMLTAQVIKEKATEAIKFRDYFAYQEALKKIPSHRALAVFRGQQESFLRVGIEFPDAADNEHCIGKIAAQFHIKNLKRAADAWLAQTVEWTWSIKLKLKIDVDLLSRLREAAELEAIKVFQENLKNLLMAAPAGHKVTLGLDPGIRTGVKVVVVDDTGKLLTHTTIFPHEPRKAWDESIVILSKLCAHFKVSLVSIGNGTASRETDALVAELIKKHPELKLTKVVVSEAGASIYSASELAAKEFPDLDVVYRGAVSIARRLQDPLAELVKIDPKSIGVGQYQHDVNQIKLGRSLNAVVEDCVNAVGADVNTASVPLLKSIAGLDEGVAKNIVAFREANGRFTNRDAIKKVPRLGDKTFQQAIGFLRIIDGENPLDASSVHPEAYPLVDQILQKTGKSIKEIMGDVAALNHLRATELVSDQFGLPTVQDILKELQKPGRDPRPEFQMAKFTDGINELSDLKPDMILEGVVTNVTKFGAFVDIGVHQDGLVHISQLADKYVSDPSEVVKVGMIVKVKVVEVDLERKRAQLTMRLNAGKPTAKSDAVKKESTVKKPFKSNAKPAAPQGAFAAALLGALKK